jgi:hypothetical protein
VEAEERIQGYKDTLKGGHQKLALKLKEAFIMKLKEDLCNTEEQLNEVTAKNVKKKAKIRDFREKLMQAELEQIEINKQRETAELKMK